MAPRKRQRRKDARPEEIVSAALELFGNKGYSNTTLSTIADAADISRTTIYLYFEDKEAILRQAFEDRVAPIFQDGHAQVAQVEMPFEQLFRMVIGRMYDRLTDKTTLILLKIIIAEGHQIPDLVRFHHENILSIAERLVEGLLKTGIAEGAVRPSIADMDPKLLIAPIIVAAMWRLTFEHLSPIDIDEYIAGHLDILMKGILVKN
ncbi:TetR/AcrR family transcriptional regulator [Gymnodinialimonas hymeniacidonis]|uniref:TetR/AcrR family transcriptional regulator n=1 Tax=Gymnodinialimonas hymeniacidonis TaxID=3126508 RepID=UPI0034C6B06F